MDNTVICDSCGKTYGIGDSPFCRDNHESVAGRRSFRGEYYDDNVAPPPGPEFRPPRDIQYDPGKGYRITNPGDLNRLMKRNNVEARDRLHKDDRLPRSSSHFMQRRYGR